VDQVLLRDKGRPTGRAGELARSEQMEKAVTRAIGEELRKAREINRWSRGFIVKRMPSGIGDRTLLSYESGSRALTILRFMELCQALEVSPLQLLGVALQRARIRVDSIALQVDLNSMIADDTQNFRSMTLWARNKLAEQPDGIAAIEPVAVQAMATMMGISHRELANYLARFTPDIDQFAKDAPTTT
jgi:transcriptional regulator with XRE-family HTH domain